MSASICSLSLSQSRIYALTFTWSVARSFTRLLAHQLPFVCLSMCICLAVKSMRFAKRSMKVNHEMRNNNSSNSRSSSSSNETESTRNENYWNTKPFLCRAHSGLGCRLCKTHIIASAPQPFGSSDAWNVRSIFPHSQTHTDTHMHAAPVFHYTYLRIIHKNDPSKLKTACAHWRNRKWKWK